MSEWVSDLCVCVCVWGGGGRVCLFAYCFSLFCFVCLTFLVLFSCVLYNFEHLIHTVPEPGNIENQANVAFCVQSSVN